MRSVLLLLCLCSIPAQEPLSTGMNEAQQYFNQALLSMSQGKMQVLEKMPIEYFSQNIGRLDTDDQRIVRNRQRDVQELINRLPKALQALAIKALDEKCKEYRLNNRSPNGLVHFLPAPTAKKHLQEYADYFFDHGQMISFLQLAQLLRLKDKRVDVAGEIVGNGFTLYKPGLLVKDKAPLVALHRGQDIEWVVHNHFIHACDPWHTVLWQRALGKYVEIQTGPEHILIKDKRGFSIIDKNGYTDELINIPQAKSISINRQRAWFQINNTVYAHHLISREIKKIVLPSEPIGTPLDDGTRSLWLCEHELIFATADEQHSIRHQLNVTKDWKLSHNGKHIYLFSDSGASYRISPFDESADKTLLLCLNQSFEKAWLQCTDHAAYKEQWLNADTNFIKNRFDVLEKLPYSDEERLLLYHRIHKKNYPEAMIRLIRGVLATNSDFVLPMGENDFLRGRKINQPGAELKNKLGLDFMNYNTYRHKLSIHGIATIITHPADLALPAQLEHLLSQGISPLQTTSQALQKHLTDSNRFAAQLQENGDILVTCHDQHQRLFWQHRILKPGYHPSLSLGIRSHYLVLSVGIQHCYILDKQTGSILSQGLIPGPYNDPKHIRMNQQNIMSSIGPTGIGNTLLFHQRIDDKEHIQYIPLKKSTRWHLPLGKHMLCSTGQSAFIYPSMQSIDLPKQVIQAKTVSVRSNGIQADEHIFLWK